MAWGGMIQIDNIYTPAVKQSVTEGSNTARRERLRGGTRNGGQPTSFALFSPAGTVEATRGTHQAVRVTAEVHRVTAEVHRVTAEVHRVTEAIRVTVKASRVAIKANRVTIKAI